MNWLHEPKMSDDNFLSKFSPKKKRKYKKMMLTSPKFLCLSLNITLPNYSRSSTKLTPCAPGHTTVFQYSSQNVLGNKKEGKLLNVSCVLTTALYFVTSSFDSRPRLHIFTKYSENFLTCFGCGSLVFASCWNNE